MNASMFVVVGLFSRFLQGAGAAGLGTSIVAVISVTHRENLSTIFGIQQTLTGVSLIIGPLLGGGLYAIGGFSFIFYVFAVGFFISVAFLQFALPVDEKYEEPKIPITWLMLFSSRVTFI